MILFANNHSPATHTLKVNPLISGETFQHFSAKLFRSIELFLKKAVYGIRRQNRRC